VATPDFEPAVKSRLREVLPDFASIANPLDTTAAITYEPALLGRMVEATLDSAEVDGILVAISTLTGAQAQTIAQDLVRLSAETSKPIIVGWTLPRSTIAPAVAILRAARIPVYDSLVLATAAVAALCRG
jgi:acetate---CoA ligase (ADP-forming)